MSEAKGGEKRPVKQGTTLFKGATVVATFAEQGDVKDASIFVGGNVIKWVGPTSDLPPEYQNPDAVSLAPNWAWILGPGPTHTQDRAERQGSPASWWPAPAPPRRCRPCLDVRLSRPLQVVDCTDLVIIPGMVNTHHHM